MGWYEELVRMLLKKNNSFTFQVFSFSEKSRDPRFLRSVQKYHVFQRFYGSSLESVSPKVVVTQAVKPKSNFSVPKNKKAHVGSINSITFKTFFFLFLS